eukprot:365806-Chlamydomonas_euryale.AAC.13
MLSPCARPRRAHLAVTATENLTAPRGPRTGNSYPFDTSRPSIHLGAPAGARRRAQTGAPLSVTKRNGVGPLVIEFRVGTRAEPLLPAGHLKVPTQGKAELSTRVHGVSMDMSTASCSATALSPLFRGVRICEAPTWSLSVQHRCVGVRCVCAHRWRAPFISRHAAPNALLRGVTERATAAALRRCRAAVAQRCVSAPLPLPLAAAAGAGAAAAAGAAGAASAAGAATAAATEASAASAASSSRSVFKATRPGHLLLLLAQ